MTTKNLPASNRTVWKLHREVVLLGGWGRAVLLQIAHPLVAQGVDGENRKASSAESLADEIFDDLAASRRN